MNKKETFILFTDQLKVEKREDGEKESRKIVGYAAMFDKWSRNFGTWFREKIQRGAFDDTDMTDVVALFNHDPDRILARVGKTLKLDVDELGLRFEFEAPNTTTGNDLLESINRGDVTGCSFAFTIKEDEWHDSETDEVEEDRIITKIGRLFDVGPVTFPAYPDTILAGAKRTFEEKEKPEAESLHQLDNAERELQLIKYS